MPARQPQRVLERVIQGYRIVDEVTGARREVGVLLSAFPRRAHVEQVLVNLSLPLHLLHTRPYLTGDE